MDINEIVKEIATGISEEEVRKRVKKYFKSAEADIDKVTAEAIAVWLKANSEGFTKIGSSFDDMMGEILWEAIEKYINTPSGKKQIATAVKGLIADYMKKAELSMLDFGLN